MRGAEPFRIEGKTGVGFMLVHGFEDSPYTMRNLGDLLAAEGHSVIAPLLPGHGTNVKDFARTRYEHWLTAVRELYARERVRHEHFFMIGFSMGGNLCLSVAAELKPEYAPTGIICIAAPVSLYGFLNGRWLLRDPRLLLTGILKNFITHMTKATLAVAENVMIPWVGYSEAYTLATLHSFKLGIGRVKNRLYRIKAPTCLIHAVGDKTVHIENLHHIFRKISSTEKRAYVFKLDENLSTHHVLTTHQLAREKVFHYILEFVHDTLKAFDLKPVIFSPGGSKKDWLGQLKKFRGYFGS